MATQEHTRAIEPANPLEFLTANGTYRIDPATTLGQMQDDMTCFLECASGIVNTIMDAANDPDGQLWASPKQIACLTYAADYLLDMAKSLHAATFSMARTEAQA